MVGENATAKLLGLNLQTTYLYPPSKGLSPCTGFVITLSHRDMVRSLFIMAHTTNAENSALYIATLQHEEMEVYSDDYNEARATRKEVIIPAQAPVSVEAAAPLPVHGPPVRSLKRKARATTNEPPRPVTELTTASEHTPGSYFMVLGAPGRPTVRAIISEDGTLYIYPLDCMAAAGFISLSDIMLRLVARFGIYDIKPMAHGGNSRNRIACGTIEEVLRILEHYMEVCRKDTTEYAEIIRRLKTFIN